MLNYWIYYVKRALHNEGDNVKNHLERLRNERGLTQQELADQLEVSRQTIISLEQGRYNPSILLAFRTARFFGLLIEDVFIYEEGNENEK